MKHRLTAALLLPVALVGAGCGKTSHKTASAATTSTTSTTATTVAGGGSTTTSKPGAATTATTARPGATTTTVKVITTTTAPIRPLTAKADKACVHPGDKQGVTITGESEVDVGYDTIYSDQSDAMTTHYETGFGKGKTDKDGVFHETWVVPVQAPAGTATIQVAGATHHARVDKATTTFLIKAIGQGC